MKTTSSTTTLLKALHDTKENDQLQKQYKNLEMEWDSIKQSISSSTRRSSASVVDENVLFQTHEKSPKELMSMLQNENSPLEQCDQAAVEIVQQRMADFDNGRIKGRRLFEDSDVGSDEDGKMRGECLDMDEKSEVSTQFSYKGFEKCDENYDKVCMGSSRSEVTAEKDVMAMVVAAKSGRRHGPRVRGSVGQFMFFVVITLFALGVVVFKCSGQEDEQVLVPT